MLTHCLKQLNCHNKPSSALEKSVGQMGSILTPAALIKVVIFSAWYEEERGGEGRGGEGRGGEGRGGEGRGGEGRGGERRGEERRGVKVSSV